MALAGTARAEAVRVATWAAEFSRDGPGVLLRDMRRGALDPALGPIVEASADVLLLTDFDYDLDLIALDALRARLAERGLAYPHVFARRPNTGMPTGRDLDGDGRLGGPRDAQGYGRFSGQGGLAVLSRLPLAPELDLTELLWRDVPDSAIAEDDPGHDIQRLSSSAHWALRAETPAGPLILMTLAATPPVFDGPEDRNGRRNRDEVLLWTHWIDGRLPGTVLPGAPVVLLGNLNIDPARGDGRREAAQAVLAHPRLTDPLPDLPTVSWDSTGPMRVSYVLPDATLGVAGAGVMDAVPEAGPHGLVWVDLVPGGEPGPAQSPSPAPLPGE